MSQYYMAGDVVLWNPSTVVSRLFLGQLRLFEKELRRASGVGSMESDECQVDLGMLNEFARALAAGPPLRNHAVIRTLSDGFVVTFLSIAQRAGLVESWPPPADAIEAEFRERARALEGSLPR
jgi:hypothetical protein